MAERLFNISRPTTLRWLLHYRTALASQAVLSTRIVKLREFHELKKLRRGSMGITNLRKMIQQFETTQGLLYIKQAKDAKGLVNSKYKKLPLLLSNR